MVKSLQCFIINSLSRPSGIFEASVVAEVTSIGMSVFIEFTSMSEQFTFWNKMFIKSVCYFTGMIDRCKEEVLVLTTIFLRTMFRCNFSITVRNRRLTMKSSVSSNCLQQKFGIRQNPCSISCCLCKCTWKLCTPVETKKDIYYV